jgi:glyoxylase-like metal-dependent hydrolase (beta-lactamase superfamily II)
VDLPGSNSDDMYYSIQKLASLPDDTLLLPGHNYSEVPHATMGDTKKVNPYMRIKDLEGWKMFFPE